MPLPQDKVFIAVTRPSTFAGTHFGAVILNVIFTLYAFVFTDSLWMLAVAIPIHAVCWGITKYDPHAFRLIGLKINHAFETLANRPRWKASSRAPHAKRRF